MWKRSPRPPKPIADDSLLLRAYPELAVLKDPAERRRAWLAAHRTVRRRRFLALAFTFIAFVLALLLLQTAGDLIRAKSWGWIWFKWLRLPVEFFTLFAAGYIFAGFFSRHFDRALRKELAQRGCPICLHCGYDLQGQTIPRCPECGQPFDPLLLEHRKTTQPASKP